MYLDFLCHKVHFKNDSRRKFALKAIRKQAVRSPGQKVRIFAEKHILMDLQSPFIVRSELHTDKIRSVIVIVNVI